MPASFWSFLAHKSVANECNKNFSIKVIVLKCVDSKKCAQQAQSAANVNYHYKKFLQPWDTKWGQQDYLETGDTLWKSPVRECFTCCSQRWQQALHGYWHLLMSWCSRDSQSLLGQITGSVTVNKTAIPTQLERTGCWSACVNLKALQGSPCPLLWHKQS